MPLRLNGISHALIITAPDKATAERTGVWMSVELCFGPGDGNSIAQIEYVRGKGDKQMVWRLPTVQVGRDGKTVRLPVFTGSLGEEITEWAARAFERVRKDKPQHPKLNRIYRVIYRAKGEEGVEEIERKAAAIA